MGVATVKITIGLYKGQSESPQTEAPTTTVQNSSSSSGNSSSLRRNTCGSTGPQSVLHLISPSPAPQGAPAPHSDSYWDPSTLPHLTLWLPLTHTSWTGTQDRSRTERSDPVGRTPLPVGPGWKKAKMIALNVVVVFPPSTCQLTENTSITPSPPMPPPEFLTYLRNCKKKRSVPA